MNSKSLRRLAGDHGSLHTAGLPPNYLFPPATDPGSDLTSLDVLLTGPTGTPYSEGVWRLHLDIPPTYPTAPPTATFRTRLWHPNVDESTGAVCVETLKRDWSSTLKLRDVLVTISCLLIQPNPASALNEAAGKLASEDWEGFCRRAKLMTGIHAAIPGDLVEEVREAQMRGDEKDEVKGKGKEKANITPSASLKRKSKVQRYLSEEDEENTRRRGDTLEPESDPESDWIPGPVKSPKPFAASRDNIFGIKGLEDDMQLDTPLRKLSTPTRAKSKSPTKEGNHDESDPFITIPSKRHPLQPFSLNLPHPSSFPSTNPPSKTEPSTSTPDTLKFSHQNPYSAIQPNNQVHPLLEEFSWSWQDSEVLHETGMVEGETKVEVRKRMAGGDFEERRSWELKRFRKTGWDLKRYNRGDFGARVGVGRL
ncbi:UBC-like protein [Zopfia rhizophila CBS 207.26]|uniref:UBC-like protein n=1 Tax=Zopfia rhizophila CBS 207.26 TaxID=1314779 RepID=A0A6A6DSV2_9PEZI|nr:UBC-like protein [Zopfia rhizophila CBS 207.26]